VEHKREAALIALASHPADKVIGPVSDQLVDDSSSTSQGACLDVLERVGAVVNLGEIRTDGWFERLGGKIANFDAICDVMGDRFLAYSMILGIQIHSIATDPRVPANTTIEFSVGDDVPQTLTLGEFRVRMVQALIQQQRSEHSISLPLKIDDAIALIGHPLLLLAPLFDLSLKHLALSSAELEQPQALVGFVSEHGFSFMDLDAFESFVKQKVRRDLAGTQQDPFQLDLTAVERARDAASRGEPEEVIAILETWPGLLVTLQKSPVIHQIEGPQLSLIAEGVELLGNAFKARERRTWAEELYRLGLVFVRDGVPAGRLFYRLGTLLCEDERYGEAIGLLRRAHALGVEEREVFPVLGRAFLRRRKLVPAAALLEIAVADGADSEGVEEDLAQVRREFAEAGVAWDVPIRDSDPPTS
jgi:hypothetical protein